MRLFTYSYLYTDLISVSLREFHVTIHSSNPMQLRFKSIITSLLLAILTLTLTLSCSRSEPNLTEKSAESAPTSNFRVAMITNGAQDDGSWSQSGYEGLQLIKEKFHADVAFTGELGYESGEEPLRQYAEEGYDFIIAHSGAYIESAEKIADEFPRTKFAIVTTYPGNNRNLGAVAFRSGEVGYLTGVLAAMTTQTNKVAYIVGADYPVYQEEAALFRKGALATNPNLDVATEYLQTWTNGERGQEVALKLVDQGYDIFAINADEAGVAALKAVAERDGTRVIGWTTDQHELAPDRVITSVLQDIPKLVFNSADLMQQGRWEGKLYKFGLKEGIYDFAPFRGSLTPEQEATFNEIREQVMTGAIDISPN